MGMGLSADPQAQHRERAAIAKSIELGEPSPPFSPGDPYFIPFTHTPSFYLHSCLHTMENSLFLPFVSFPATFSIVSPLLHYKEKATFSVPEAREIKFLPRVPIRRSFGVR